MRQESSYIFPTKCNLVSKHKVKFVGITAPTADFLCMFWESATVEVYPLFGFLFFRENDDLQANKRSDEHNLRDQEAI